MNWLLGLAIVVALVAIILHQATTKTSGANVYTGRAHAPVLVIAGGAVVLAFLWALISSLGR